MAPGTHAGRPATQATVPAEYGVQGIPSTWLIGPDGRVLAKNLRGEAIRRAVADAMNR